MELKEISIYITVRDGTQLSATIYLPQNISTPIPIAWKHDRYHSRNKSPEDNDAFERFKKGLLEKDIAVAVVDSRGSGASFGTSSGPFSQDEQHDMFDLTEWFAKQAWCSGKVAMFGRSYSGIAQYLAAAMQPPHLVAIAPEMALFDLYQFAYPNGIFRHDFAHAWGKNVFELDQVKPVKGVDADTDGKRLNSAREQHKDNADIYQLFAERPYADSRLHHEQQSLYKTNSPNTYVEQINASGVAILHIAGWQDLWPNDTLLAFKKLDTPQALLIGPWSHDSYCTYLTEKIISIFDALLNSDLHPEVVLKNQIEYYTFSTSPNNAWKTTNSWPPEKNDYCPLYLHESSLQASPTEAEKEDQYTSYKVDYTTTSGGSSRWANGYGTALDYSNLDKLVSKCATFRTAPYDTTIEITGHPRLELAISTHAADFDLFAYMIDVHPDGYHEYITEGCLRASRCQGPRKINALGYRHYPCTADSLALIKDNHPFLYELNLHPTSKKILPGHTLLIAICCCDHDNTLTPYTMPEPEIKIHWDKKHQSSLLLPLQPIC